MDQMIKHILTNVSLKLLSVKVKAQYQWHIMVLAVSNYKIVFIVLIYHNYSIVEQKIYFIFFIVLVKNIICPPFCPSIYKPVCGSNNVTYPNLCSLRFADCEFENDEKITLKHKGTCKEKGIN